MALAPITWKAGRSPLGRIGQDAGRGLHVVAAQQRAVSTPLRSQQLDQEVAERSAPMAPALRVRAPSFASVSAVPPAVPAAVARICSTSCAALALGDRLDGPDEHVEHVHAERDDRGRHRAPYPRAIRRR